MKSNIYAIICLLFIFSCPILTSAQGCVAVRNMSSCSLLDTAATRSWQLSLNYRYFRSFRHFVGSDEQEHRMKEGSQVINNDNSWILGINYTVSPRLSTQISIPVIYIDRSSLYEHNRTERYHTSSRGLGDIRISAYYSALPRKSRTSLVAGLGLKLPTGDYNYKDYFHKPEGIQLLPVDQSIQPGDGGTGIITEVNMQYSFSHSFNGYATGYYMFNPRNTNGTLRGPNLVDNIPLSNEMSVADQFLVRLGGLYKISAFQLGLGGRIEGIPAKDAIGESDGFRRPGYIISSEASVNYVKGRHSISLQVPVALVRNRTRSVIDQTRPGLDPRTGKQFHGDAAFADWLLSITYAYKIPR